MPIQLTKLSFPEARILLFHMSIPAENSLFNILLLVFQEFMLI